MIAGMGMKDSPYEPCWCRSGLKTFQCHWYLHRGYRDAIRNHARDRAALVEWLEKLDAPLREAFERAVRRSPCDPALRFGAALNHYHSGRVSMAVEHLDRLTADLDPGHVPALAMLVHLDLLLGRDEAAREAADRLLALDSPDDRLPRRRCEVLARLDRREELEALAARCMKSASGRGDRAAFAFLRGAALANLDEHDRAGPLFELGRESPDYGRLAAFYADLVSRRRTPPTLYLRWPCFPVEAWLSPALILCYGVNCPGRDAALVFGAGTRHLVDSLLVDRCSDDWRLVENDALDVIGALAGIVTPASTQALRDMAFGLFGTDAVRYEAAASLARSGRLEGSEVADGREGVRIFLGGRMRPVACAAFEETTITLDSEADAKIRRMYEGAERLLEAGKRARAVALAGRMVLAQPRSSLAHYLRSLILFGAGNPEEGVDALVRAGELDPLRIDGRWALAYIHSQVGDLVQAASLLDRDGGYVVRSVPADRVVYYETELFMLLDTYFRLEREPGQDTAARRLEILDDALELLDLVHELGRGITLPGLIEQLEVLAAEGWPASDPGAGHGLADRMLPRPISRRRTAAEALGGYTTGELACVGRSLGLEGLETQAAEALQGVIAAGLERKEPVRRGLEGLGPEERRALEALCFEGGVMAVDEFARRFGFRRGDSLLHPRGVRGRLEASGLAAEGVIMGRPSVFVPAPVLDALRAMPGFGATGTRRTVLELVRK